MESKVFITIIAVCAVLILIGVFRKKMDLFLNFVLRVFVGFLAIYLVNTILMRFSLNISVGVNEINALVLGLLGTPGFLLLYGVAFYYCLK